VLQDAYPQLHAEREREDTVVERRRARMEVVSSTRGCGEANLFGQELG
jgi:hypothetical protein